MPDTLQRFLFEHADVRGEIVHLDESWQEVLARHDYPVAVREPLGELLAAAALLSATIKFDGSIILQISGGDPIEMMVVECRPQKIDDDNVEYRLRGMARWSGNVPDGNLSKRFGAANLVITIDPGRNMKRYQGIVELHGNHLSEALGHYLDRSEQLATRLWLASDDKSAAGLLVQRLPGQEADDEEWNRVTTLAETITDKELLELKGEEVLHRLFHEEDRRMFDPSPIRFECHCSRERVANTLRGMQRSELEQMIDEDGPIEVSCQFCNQKYSFDKIDLEQVFAEETPQPDVGPTRH